MVALQIRNISDEMRDTLAREAQSRGVSLQSYLEQVLAREIANIRNRNFVESYDPIKPMAGESVDVVEIIKESRAQQDRKNLARTARRDSR